MSDLVKCEVCGKLFKRVTHKHLKQHNMSLADYTKMYPDATLISESTRLGLATNSQTRFIAKYGEVLGMQKYAEYCKFQGEKNTFAYKESVYGWGADEFSEYNAGRAATLKNYITRYGDVDGVIRWEEYRQLQAVNGCTIEWFIGKYGAIDGAAKYAEVCLAKAQTLANCVNKHGDIEGNILYNKRVVCSSVLG